MRIKQRFCSLFLCLALSGLPLTALAENRALLIGVGRYNLPEANLPGIEVDLKLMEEGARLMGFQPTQIKTIRDNQATLSGITQAIDDWLISGVSSSDSVLLYFSGHGSQIPDLNGDESDKADEVLLPHDMRMSGSVLANTFVDDDFGKVLSRIPAGMILVMIDSCHSGTATKRIVISNGEYPKFFPYPGMPKGWVKGRFTVVERENKANYIGLSASMDNESALATREGSLFTRGVVETLRGARESRYMTMNQLRAASESYIARYASSPSKVHHPQISGDQRLADKNIFVAAGASPPPPEDMWTRLEDLVEKADYTVEVQTNKDQFQVGEKLRIICKVQRGGYLNILNLSPGDKEVTVLFPNKFRQENRVSAGATITLPGPQDRFDLRASPPTGKSLIVVFNTDAEINAYKEGMGSFKDLFKTMSEKTVRGFEVTERRNDSGFGAGKSVSYIQ